VGPPPTTDLKGALAEAAVALNAREREIGIAKPFTDERTT
jgi:hypothetical protein